MASDSNIIGISMNLDVSDLKSGLKEAQGEIKKSKDEFNAATAGLDNWQKSAEGVYAKVKQLNTQLSAQTKIIDGYKAEIKRVSAQEGNHSATLEKLNKKLADAENAFKITKGQIDKYNNSLYKIKTMDLSKSFEGLKSSIASIGKVAAGAFAGLTAGIVGAVESTRESRQFMNQLYTAFGEVGVGVDDVTKMYQKFYGVLGNDSEVSKAMATMSNMSSSTQDMNKWLTISTGVYAQFGRNIPIDALMKASNETAQTGQVSGQLGKILKQAGIDADLFQKKLSLCGTTQRRLEVITNTLQGRFGSLAEQFKETNSSIIEAREIQNELGNKLQDLGQAAEPIVNKVKELGIELIDKMMPTVQSLAANIDTFMPKLVGSIKNLIPVVFSLTTAWITYKTAMTIGPIINSVISLGKAILSATIKQTALNAVMAANPFGMVAVAVGLLVGAIGGLVAKQKLFNETVDKTIDKTTKWADKQEELNNSISKYVSAINKSNSAITNRDKEIALARQNKAWDELKEKAKQATAFINLYYGAENTLEKQNIKFDKQKALNKRPEIIDAISTISDLSIELLKSGDSADTLQDKLIKLGVNQRFVNKIVSEATEKFKQLQKAQNQEKEPKENKPTKSNDFYSATLFAEDKKNYDEWTKLREAREYKLATLSADLTEAEKVRATRAIDAQMAKYDESVKRYTQAMMKMQTVTEDAFDNIDGTQEQTTEKASNFCERFREKWATAIEGLGVSAEQLFETISDMATQFASTISTVIDSIGECWDNYYEAEFAKLEKEAKKKDEAREHDLTEIEKQYMNYEITLEEFKEKKARIESDINNNEISSEEELAEKKEALERERDEKKRQIFEAEKAAKIAEIWIQNAIGGVGAMTQALLTFPPPAGPIIGAANVAMLLAQAISATAVTASQQYISAFAKGGIIDRPTLGIVGEAGKEAIMPLENNTEWISELATKINAIQKSDFSGIIGTQNYSYAGDTTNNNSNYNYTQNIYAPTALSRFQLYRAGKRLLTLGR